MYYLVLGLDEDFILSSAATGMKWIETKMKGLGVESNSNYKISFYLDCDAMISVHTPKYGVIEVIIRPIDEFIVML